MKRTITVKAYGLSIVARLDTHGAELSRDEVDMLRDQLADRLLDAASDLKYIGTAKNRIKVS